MVIGIYDNAYHGTLEDEFDTVGEATVHRETLKKSVKAEEHLKFFVVDVDPQPDGHWN